MPINLGSSAVTLYLGDQPVNAYLGEVLLTAPTVTVPGAPTIVFAIWDTDIFYAAISAEPDDGGSAITGYNLYFDDTLAASGVEPNAEFVLGINPELTDRVGQSFQVSAVNAIGEGPKSEPFIVTGL